REGWNRSQSPRAHGKKHKTVLSPLCSLQRLSGQLPDIKDRPMPSNGSTFSIEHKSLGGRVGNSKRVGNRKASPSEVFVPGREVSPADQSVWQQVLSYLQLSSSAGNA